MSHVKLKHRVSGAALNLLRPTRACFSLSVSGSASRRGLGSGWAGPAASGWAGGDLGPRRQSPSRAFQGSIALRGLTSPQRLQSGTAGRGGGVSAGLLSGSPESAGPVIIGAVWAARGPQNCCVRPSWRQLWSRGRVCLRWVPAARVSHLRAALGLGWPRAGAAVGGPCSPPDAGPALLSLPAWVRSAGCSPSAPASSPVLICSRTGRGCWVCHSLSFCCSGGAAVRFVSCPRGGRAPRCRLLAQ